MTSSELLDEIESQIAYAENLKEHIDDLKRWLDHSKQELAETEQKILQLKNKVKNYWRKNEGNPNRR